MKKRSLAVVAMAAALTLAACSEDEKTTDPVEPETPEVEEVEEVETPEAEEVEVEEEPKAEEEEKVEAEEPKPEAEPAVAEDVTTSTTEPAAAPIEDENKNLNYDIDVPEGFALSEEEPGKDIIHSEANSESFVRIESEPFSEETFNYYDTNGKETLSFSGVEGAEVEEIDSPIQADRAKAYRVKADTGYVSVYVFQKGDKVVRTTVFDDAEQSNAPTFNNIINSIR